MKYLDFLEEVDHCITIEYTLKNIIIEYSSYNYYYQLYDKKLYINFKDINNYNETILELINDNIKEINSSIKGKCTYCYSNYILSNDNECFQIKPTITDCSIISMIKNKLYYNWKDLCYNNKYPLVLINTNKKNNESSYITISELYNKLNNYLITLKEIKEFINFTLCVNNSDNNEDYNLQNCIIASYIVKEKKYICQLCQSEYFFYKEENRCIRYDEQFNCEYENIGNKTNPILSCKKCLTNYNLNNYYSYFNMYGYYYNYIFYKYNTPLDN